MYEYMTFEEILTTLSAEELEDLMIDCCVDDWAETVEWEG